MNHLDMYALLTCWLGIGAVGFDNIEDYWTPFQIGGLLGGNLGRIMPRYKFKMAWAALRLYDCTKARRFEDGKYSKTYKCEAFLKHMAGRFQNSWNAGRWNSLDEAGIPSRHRWCRHFNPNKPHKYCIELLVIADSATGRPIIVLMMEGSSRFVDEQGNPCTKRRYRTPQITKKEWARLDSGDYTNVMAMFVDHMAQKLPPGSTLVQDSRFNFLPAMYRLYVDRQISVLGTVNWNRKYMPLYCLKLTEEQTEDRGFYQGAVLDFEHEGGPKILSSVTQDSKAVLVVSTCSSLAPALQHRGMKGSKDSGWVTAPTHNVLFNEKMGGVDALMQATLTSAGAISFRRTKTGIQKLVLGYVALSMSAMRVDVNYFIQQQEKEKLDNEDAKAEDVEDDDTDSSSDHGSESEEESPSKKVKKGDIKKQRRRQRQRRKRVAGTRYSHQMFYRMMHGSMVSWLQKQRKSEQRRSQSSPAPGRVKAALRSSAQSVGRRSPLSLEVDGIEVVKVRHRNLPHEPLKVETRAHTVGGKGHSAGQRVNRPVETWRCDLCEMKVCRSAEEAHREGARRSRGRSSGASNKKKSCLERKGSTVRCTRTSCSVCTLGGRPVRLCTNKWGGCGCWNLWHDPTFTIPGIDTVRSTNVHIRHTAVL